MTVSARQATVELDEPAAVGVAVRPLPSARTPKRAILATPLRNRRAPTVDRVLPLLFDAAAARMHNRVSRH